MVKRELKRNFNKYGKYFEPIEVMFLLLLIGLPVIAVINLSPQTGLPPQNAEDVLGLTTSEEAQVEEIGGTHEFIADEHLYTDNSSQFSYQATLLRRDPGVYTKPILLISNPSSNEITVRFTLTDSEASSTQIGVMRDKVNYVVKDSAGERFPREFKLNPGEEAIFHIDVRNDLVKNFTETLQLRINLYGSDQFEQPKEVVPSANSLENTQIEISDQSDNLPIDDLAEANDANDIDQPTNQDQSTDVEEVTVELQ